MKSRVMTAENPAYQIFSLRWTFALIALVCGFALTHHAAAYSLIGGSWPSGNVSMQLQLDATAPSSPALPLADGAATWNSIAVSAMQEWNTQLSRSQFTWTTNPGTTGKQGDGVNQVFFSKMIYGSSFDKYTLAVTLVDNFDDSGMPTVRNKEADLIVNANVTWNSYRGSLQSNTDIRRVLLHELGHVLGLDHPDTASPAQRVAAIMNSTVSNIETLRTDDVSGVQYLYSTTIAPVTITSQLQNQTVAVSGHATLAVGVNNATTAPAPKTGLLGYAWYFKAPGTSTYERLNGVDTASLDLGSVQSGDAGSYYVQVVTPDSAKSAQSQPATLTVSSVTTSPDTSLANISTRGLAGSGSSTMIVGFVVTGTKPKTVLLRAVGPGLAAFGVPGTLADPTLTLTAASNGSAIATSAAVWDQSTNAADIRSTAQRVGAFPLPAGSHDAVVLATVPPGNYTAQATSPSGQTGVVLIEAYDADLVRDTTSRLANLSSRGFIGTADNVLIAGFSVTGPGPHTYLIRVSGASIAKAPFNVTSTIIDPILTLFSGNSTQLRVNDDWDSPASGQAALNTAFGQVGAFGYPYPSTVNGTRDDTAMQSAMLVTLQPGTYSVQASGNPNNGTTDPTGNALVEIYEVP